jgi:hypothetical protein
MLESLAYSSYPDLLKKREKNKNEEICIRLDYQARSDSLGCCEADSRFRSHKGLY